MWLIPFAGGGASVGALMHRAWYREQNMPLFTWSSLANGFMAGRISRQNFESIREIAIELGEQRSGIFQS